MIARRFLISNAALLPMRRQRLRQIRGKSTLALSHLGNERILDSTSTTKNPVPDFENARIAYETKSTHELLRAAICFRACKIPFLVEHAEDILQTSRSLFGGRLVDSILKASLYGHFCAGEDQERIQPIIQQLKSAGVGSILDYAAESDDASDSSVSSTNKDSTIVAREYDYESEAKCDQHLSAFLRCIRDVAASSSSQAGEEQRLGYAAIKVTALGNPKLLARLSTAIIEAKRLFSIFDRNRDGLISREEFELGYNRYFTDGDKRIPDILQEFDPLETGYLDYIAWSMMLSPEDLPNVVKSCRDNGRLFDACPTDEEIDLLNAMYDRGRRLAEEASELGVRLLIDAEQVRYQPAIDNLVLELQRQFNGDSPVVYNTYQCYLRDAPERLRTDVSRSERFGYHFGAKLVRGAYMESERELARAQNQSDPIHATIADTHNCYNDAVDYLLKHSTQSNRKVEMMCATHNKQSIVQAIERMNEYGIDQTSSIISFAQLYGMSDQLTFNLGKHGYRAYKYVPYGEVHEVMPYLLRRAQENSAIVGGACDELTMIGAELQRRLGIRTFA